MIVEQDSEPAVPGILSNEFTLKTKSQMQTTLHQVASNLPQLDIKLNVTLNPTVSACDVDAAQDEFNRMSDEGGKLIGVWPITNGANPPQINQAIHHFKRPIA